MKKLLIITSIVFLGKVYGLYANENLEAVDRNCYNEADSKASYESDNWRDAFEQCMDETEGELKREDQENLDNELHNEEVPNENYEREIY